MHGGAPEKDHVIKIRMANMIYMQCIPTRISYVVRARAPRRHLSAVELADDDLATYLKREEY